MTPAILAVSGLLFFAIFLHVSSIALAMGRCRPPRGFLRAARNAPPISLVRPVCGLDNYAEDTLGSAFGLAYPDYEIIFCVAQTRDPVIPLLRRLIAAHPNQRAVLLIGDDRISENPKLNNCAKGWRAAKHDWIVLADSNVMMPPDYLTRLMDCWDDGTGLVCSPPAGSQPASFWASVECAFLNTYQARWQYAADTLSAGFAQGKTMLWRRDILERMGGIRALGRELAEDAAATRVVRAQGLRVRLVGGPFAQPLGHRTAGDVWRRQARWAQLRRSSFPLVFAPEIFSGALAPFLTAAYAAHIIGLPMAACLIALFTIWYGAEMILAWRAGWPLTAAYPVHAMLRDLMIPAIWTYGWLGSGFVWRGTPMVSAASKEATQS